LSSKIEFPLNCSFGNTSSLKVLAGDLKHINASMKYLLIINILNARCKANKTV